MSNLIPNIQEVDGQRANQSMSKSSNIRVVYGFWTGNNPLTEQRIICLKQLVEYLNKQDVRFILVTSNTLDSYIQRTGVKLHDGYKYLSAVHKSDYLRCYFMHFFGGGYADIKQIAGDWRGAFDIIEQSEESYYCIGKRGGNGGNGSEYFKKNWYKMISQAYFIFKPNTPFTREWYSKLIEEMDKYLEDLKKYPATDNEPRHQINNASYPIVWWGLLGDIFHPICDKYYENLLFGDINMRHGKRIGEGYAYL
jgi:hypothetical protein